MWWLFIMVDALL
ncbi:unnamed protein product, partial [Mesorhabditis spiculigera]